MEIKPSYKCQACWGENNVVKLTNHDIWLCAKCLQKIFPNGYLTEVCMENHLLHAKLILGDNIPIVDLKPT